MQIPAWNWHWNLVPIFTNCHQHPISGDSKIMTKLFFVFYIKQKRFSITRTSWIKRTYTLKLKTILRPCFIRSLFKSLVLIIENDGLKQEPVTKKWVLKSLKTLEEGISRKPVSYLFIDSLYKIVMNMWNKLSTWPNSHIFSSQ